MERVFAGEQVKNSIHYRDGYKYQLAADYEVITDLRPDKVIISNFLMLQPDGLLFIMAGYAFDGPSGPVIDVKEFMRASLVHDALYQLMREGKLPQRFKPMADQEMMKICIQDGMSYPLARIAYEGVEHFGYSSCEKQERKLLTAP